MGIYRQLSSTLITLSQQCAKLSKVLDEVPIRRQLYLGTSEFSPEQLPKNWPTLTISPQRPQLGDATALELCNFPSTPISPLNGCDTDLVVNFIPFYNLPENIHILADLEEAQREYDLIIINESFETLEHPNVVMTQLIERMHKRSKMFIRFRPWCSPLGAFQSDSKPYAHLLTGENFVPVYSKIIHPPHEYFELINSWGLTKLSMQYSKIEIPKMVLDWIPQIISNTWQSIPRTHAQELLSISHVDFLLGLPN